MKDDAYICICHFGIVRRRTLNTKDMKKRNFSMGTSSYGVYPLKNKWQATVHVGEGYYRLYSYGTLVAEYDRVERTVEVLAWHSKTTARHVNYFLEVLGFLPLRSVDYEKTPIVMTRREAREKYFRYHRGMPNGERRLNKSDNASVIVSDWAHSLYSYGMCVADYFPEKVYVGIHGWHSAATTRHVNEFLEKIGFEQRITKADFKHPSSTITMRKGGTL